MSQLKENRKWSMTTLVWILYPHSLLLLFLPKSSGSPHLLVSTPPTLWHKS